MQAHPFDIIVIGAGPAGTAAAWWLARSGWNIAWAQPSSSATTDDIHLVRCYQQPQILHRIQVPNCGVRILPHGVPDDNQNDFELPKNFEAKIWETAKRAFTDLTRSASANSPVQQMKEEAERAGASVVTGTAEKLLFHSGKISGIQLRQSGDTRQKLFAPVVLTAAGSLGSSRLLTASRVMDASGELGHNLGACLRLPYWVTYPNEPTNGSGDDTINRMDQMCFWPQTGESFLNLLPRIARLSCHSVELNHPGVAEAALDKSIHPFDRVRLSHRRKGWKEKILAVAKEHFAAGAHEIWFATAQPGGVASLDQLNTFLTGKELRTFNLRLDDLYGGTIAGKDPYTSVTDGFGKSWDTVGLYLTGHSLLDSMPAGNRFLHEAMVGLYSAMALENDRGSL